MDDEMRENLGNSGGKEDKKEERRKGGGEERRINEVEEDGKAAW